ncbi:MAG: hypothetical protein VKL39_15415 [Leptolyngbyaceae bacterium]|nr:hypothetical protein [Leptolyngbyaceae bacterium]
MLYLAKVSKHEETGELLLKLLARQKSEHHWVLAPSQDPVVITLEGEGYGVDSLVLADLSRDRTVESIQDATDWVLRVIKEYLVTGIDPDVLNKEAERAEEWRKDLTLKTQDLARRALELETRRDQIQELEKKLEAERQQIESTRLKIEVEKAKVGMDEPQSSNANQEPHAQEAYAPEDTQPADAVQP